MDSDDFLLASPDGVAARLEEMGLGGWIVRSWLVERHFTRSIVLSFANGRIPQLVGLDLSNEQGAVTVSRWRVTETGSAVRSRPEPVESPITNDALLVLLNRTLSGSDLGEGSPVELEAANMVMAGPTIRLDPPRPDQQPGRLQVMLGQAILGETVASVEAERLAHEVEEYLSRLSRSGAAESSPSRLAAVEPDMPPWEGSTSWPSERPANQFLISDRAILDGLSPLIVARAHLLVTDGWTVRVTRSFGISGGKINEHSNYLEIKGPRLGSVRGEISLSLADDVAAALFIPATRKVFKSIYNVVAADATWTISEYMFDHEGLITAEVTEGRQPSPSEMPAWVGPPAAAWILPDSNI